MKYFTMDLWEKMNDSSLEKRKIAEEQWEKNSNEYGEEFDKIKKYFSEKDISLYLSHHPHDAEIKRIGIYNSKEGKNVKVIMNNWKDEEIVFCYEGIEGIEIRLDKGPFYSQPSSDFIGTFGYDEFSSVGEKCLKHNILFVEGYELEVLFKNFLVTICDKENN